MEFLAKGKRGNVYTYKSSVDGKEVVVKEALPESDAKDMIHREAQFLKIANENGLGPKFLAEENDKVFMEFVHGERILDFIERSPKQGIVKVLKDSLDQARTLDEIGINKLELTNPYKHIIVNNDKPVMIDFERCKKTKNPKNVTQLVQFLTSTRMNHLLKDKDLELDSDNLRILAKQYKEKYDEKLFEKIKNKFR